jgi:hypothetical protein
VHESNAAAPIVLEGTLAFQDAALARLDGAQREVALLSYALDPRGFGSDAFAERLQAFALGSSRSRIRILVNQPQQALRNAPRLIELSRRLSSRIHCRQLPETQRLLLTEYLICDERSLLFRERHDQLQAQCHPEAPLQARRQLREFNPLWEEALPAREFSELRI